MKVHLDIDYTQFLEAEYPPAFTCAPYQVPEQKELHDSLGGYPETYCFENTRIHQIWWDLDTVPVEDMEQQLGMKVLSVSSIRKPPGSTNVYHRDTFLKIRTDHDVTGKTLWRANIHCEAWKIGHFMMYNEEVYTGWKAGDGLAWSTDVAHMAVNSGFADKYTLQISGYKL